LIDQKLRCAHYGLMKWYSKLPMRLLAVLLVIVCIALGIAIGSAAGADRGDWLSFAGALVGSALTVAGSVIVIEYQQSREQRGQEQMFLELLDDIDKACVPFQCADEDALKASYGRTVPEQVAEVNLGIARAQKYAAHMKMVSTRVMRAANVIEALNFESGDITVWLIGYKGMDLGGLNAEAHSLMGEVGKARDFLS
jgi:hypothetical protein